MVPWRLRCLGGQKVRRGWQCPCAQPDGLPQGGDVLEQRLGDMHTFTVNLGSIPRSPACLLILKSSFLFGSTG